MDDAVHWRATHPLDILPEQWPPDIQKYDLTCDLSEFGELPDDEDQAKWFTSAVRRIDSSDDCAAFRQRAVGAY